jgi:hypothetical protein
MPIVFLPSFLNDDAVPAAGSRFRTCDLSLGVQAGMGCDTGHVRVPAWTRYLDRWKWPALAARPEKPIIPPLKYGWTATSRR